MSIWSALAGELGHGIVLSLGGLLVLALQLLLYFVSGRTSPNIRFQRFEDFANNRVTFLIRNFDSVRHRGKLVVSLQPKAAIEQISVHGKPYCKEPLREDGHGNILITFDKVPADATFSIEVTRKPSDQVKLWLADSSELRPQGFNRKLEPFRGARRVSYFLARGLVGVYGFIIMFLIGLALDGDEPAPSDWGFVATAIPLALVVFVLVVPTGGKPIVAGYLGWSGASKNWPPRDRDTPVA